MNEFTYVFLTTLGEKPYNCNVCDMAHQEKMDENTQQVRRSDRKLIPSEKAVNSECNTVRNIETIAMQPMCQ